jgi:hypothetical protein
VTERVFRKNSVEEQSFWISERSKPKQLQASEFAESHSGAEF